jgi:hypothetical protein
MYFILMCNLFFVYTDESLDRKVFDEWIRKSVGPSAWDETGWFFYLYYTSITRLCMYSMIGEKKGRKSLSEQNCFSFFSLFLC